MNLRPDCCSGRQCLTFVVALVHGEGTTSTTGMANGGLIGWHTTQLGQWTRPVCKPFSPGQRRDGALSSRTSSRSLLPAMGPQKTTTRSRQNEGGGVTFNELLGRKVRGRRSQHGVSLAVRIDLTKDFPLCRLGQYRKHSSAITEEEGEGWQLGRQTPHQQ